MSYSVSRHKIEHQSRTRTFTLVTPDDLGESPAVLLFFHGSLQSSNVARNFTGHTFDELTARGVLVAYPDGVHHHFNDARRDFTERTRQLRIDDVGFTRAIIDKLVAEHGADAGRVFACGFSNGGQMRGEVLSAQRTAEYFAAVNGLGDRDHAQEKKAEDVRVDTWQRDGLAPVALVSVEGMGHLVPSLKAVDARLGEGTSSFVAAKVTADFFGL